MVLKRRIRPSPPFDAIPRPHELERVNWPGADPLSAGKKEPPRMIDFLPWVFPPPEFVPFDVVDVRTVNFGITATFPIINTQSYNAVIRWFGNETSIAAGITDIRWTILIAGVGYQPYVNMQLSRGAIDNPDPIIIRIPQNRLVEVAVQNVSGASNWEVRTRVKGWLY